MGSLSTHSQQWDLTCTSVYFSVVWEVPNHCLSAPWSSMHMSWMEFPKGEMKTWSCEQILSHNLQHPICEHIWWRCWGDIWTVCLRFHPPLLLSDQALLLEERRSRSPSCEHDSLSSAINPRKRYTSKSLALESGCLLHDLQQVTQSLNTCFHL